MNVSASNILKNLEKLYIIYNKVFYEKTNKNTCILKKQANKVVSLRKINMGKLLICPDVHGRVFWKECREEIDNYDKVIFLGDYLDPYNFEFISVETAIENFKEIIEFKKNNMDKVILLLGNHDMPYYSDIYYKFSTYHCRHSREYHNVISDLFANNHDLFQIAYYYDDVIFTHAGIEHKWLEDYVGCHEKDIDKICDTLNSLVDDEKGLMRLFCITSARGGRDRYGSCIWSDVNDMMWDIDYMHGHESSSPIFKFKQVFGHTIQAYYNEFRKIVFGKAIEFDNCKMIDTSDIYVLDTKSFTIKKLK